jgi:hypothetical protein
MAHPRALVWINRAGRSRPLHERVPSVEHEAVGRAGHALADCVSSSISDIIRSSFHMAVRGSTKLVGKVNRTDRVS